MGEILVVGSMNMDMVVETERLPDPGETVTDARLTHVPGGKGANQALAAAHQGCPVTFIGACGKDEAGSKGLKNLQAGGVNVEHVFKVEAPTGTAFITVEPGGANRIIVVPGANRLLTPDHLEYKKDCFARAGILLLQLEIPLATVAKAIDLAVKYGLTVILDPAPGRRLPFSLLEHVHYLVPNVGELDILTKESKLAREIDKVKWLLVSGVGTVLLTRGEQGVSLFRADESMDFAALQVGVVDTTAAGDVFAGVLACGLHRGWQEEEAITWAIRAAALTVTRLGAQISIPTFTEVQTFKAGGNI